MGVTSVVGANWGDEGKGKMVDYLAEKSDVVIRFQGGSNAGHTVINEHGKFALHLLPSGVFYPNVVNILGPGVALDMGELIRELDDLAKRGIAEPKVMVSERTQVMLHGTSSSTSTRREVGRPPVRVDAFGHRPFLLG